MTVMMLLMLLLRNLDWNFTIIRVYPIPGPEINFSPSVRSAEASNLKSQETDVIAS